MSDKILIIEDDLYNRDMFAQVIEGEGFIVDTAADGLEGLEKLQIGGYKLVLLDVMLPKLDGFEILRSLKKSSSRIPNGPIVLFTNLSKESVNQEALSLGAVLCVNKTEVSPSELIKLIHEVVKNEKEKETPNAST
jgi:CheY-like chemotaxis protein